MKSQENLNTDFKRMGQNFDAVKEKLTICQQDIKEFVLSLL